MLNFMYYNPVKILFGKGSISELSGLIEQDKKIMITYGSGSIMKNGVYDQVIDALKHHNTLSFGGIEPNPRYETLIKAVEKARAEDIKFLLTVGGGSVLDGTKFIAAAIPFTAGKEWDILSKQDAVESAVPLGSVLTLPATGSEMNSAAVISREATKEKLVFSTPLVYPRFSILDPETTFSLPERQTANGIVDTFVHTAEQYLTYPVHAQLQDRQAEAILLTLIEEGNKALDNPNDYDIRATLMWCATQALNGIIGRGVPQDWATHMIGHELTALYAMDHAHTLAVVLPALLKHQRKNKSAKLLKFAKRVWNIIEGDDDTRIDTAIEKTKQFFNSVGIATSLKDYGIRREGLERVGERLESRGMKLGEHKNIGRQEVDEILALSM